MGALAVASVPIKVNRLVTAPHWRLERHESCRGHSVVQKDEYNKQSRTFYATNKYEYTSIGNILRPLLNM